MIRKLKSTVIAAIALIAGAFTASAEVPLPTGYTQIETLYAPCGSYVDTKVAPKGDTRTEVTFDVIGTTEYWFGAWDGAWNDRAYAVCNDSTGVYIGYGNSGDGTKGPVVGSGVHTIAFQDGTYYLDGTSVRTATSTAAISLTSTLYLFAQNRKGTAATGSGQGLLQFKGGKIYDGQTLVRDFVPCRNEQGEAGLWDLVNGEFYGNKGTGSFRASAEVPLPTGYAQIDFIQSTGSQYINTGYKPNINTRIEASFNTGTRTGDFTTFFGGVTSGDYGINLRYNYRNNSLQCVFMDQVFVTDDMADKDVTVVLKDGLLEIGGKSYPFTTTKRDPVNVEMYIFGANKGGLNRPQNYKLYWFKIYEGETLKRDFVPCRSPSSEAGLWDKVEGKFYGSAVSTKFIGPYASDNVPSGYVPVEYIESDGITYIDTGVTAASGLSAELDYMPGVQEGTGSFGTCKDENADWRFAPYSGGCFFDCGKARLGAKSGATKLQAGTRYTVKVGYDGSSLYNEVYDQGGTRLSRLTASKNGEPREANVYLFGVNSEGTSPACTKMRVYSFKLSKGGKLVRDFVPCRNLFGEVGFWDTVDGKFYGSCGTTQLSTPAVVPAPREVELPAGYVQLDWIESTGTQHIDTGYVPNRTTQVTASFKALTRNENWAAFFSTLNNDKSDNAVSLRYYVGTYKINGLFCNTKYDEATTSGTYENANVQAALRDGAMFIDGAGYKITTSADPYQGSLILFGERNGNEIRRRQAMRLYGLTIYEGTEAVHDYVPCRQESDGARGLYDLVDKKFLPNNGDGVFNGPDKAAYAKLNGDGYDYYTVNGERVTAPETGITGLPLAFANDDEYQALVAAPERVEQATGVFLEKDVTLTADADWSKYDFNFDFNFIGHTVNLNGHKLTVSKLNGEGEVTDTSGTGYQLLSYIKSTGGQYINTGYKPNINTRIEASFNTGTRTGDFTTFFGGVTGGDYGINLRYNYRDNSLQCVFMDQVFVTDDMADKDVTVVLKDGLLEIGGKSYTFKTTKSDPVNVEMYIFGANKGGLNRPQNYKLCWFKIYEGETPKRDYVPARRMSDGRVGLLDRANNEFRPDENGGNFEAGLVTNAVSCGELHVKVASGAVENTSVALTGSLKLVKEGAGTFVAHRKDQTYFGGTQVAGGQFALWNSGQDAIDWAPDTYRTMGDVGSTIDVDSGARFNIVGNYNCCHFNFRLNGGRLESNYRPGDDKTFFLQTKTGWWGLGNTTLTTDSNYLVRFDIVHNRDIVDLGGHTLDMEFTNGKYLYWGSGIKNGTIIVHNGDTSASGASWFKTIAAVDARTVTFDMYEQFKLDNELSVSNYVSHSRNDLTNGHQGTAALNVYGAFKPVTDFFYGCTMQNGSTLDLSTRTGVWSTTSRSPTGKTAVEFAKGATVYVDLGTRRDSGVKGKIVDWTGHAPDSTVTFKEAPSLRGNGVIRAEADGLYITRGLTIFIR